MPGGARASGTVAEPRTASAGGEAAPRDASRRSWGSCGRPSLAAEAYDGLERAVRTWVGERDQAVAVAEPDGGVGDAPARHAVRGAAGVVAGQVDGGQEGERVVEPDDALGIGVRDGERADRRPAQLEAVGVAEVGDQRPHVR